MLEDDRRTGCVRVCSVGSSSIDFEESTRGAPVTKCPLVTSGVLCSSPLEETEKMSKLQLYARTVKRDL